MSEPEPPGASHPEATVPTESPNVAREYPTDAGLALQRGQEAYESTRQGEIDPGEAVPRSDRAPHDLSGASSGLAPGAPEASADETPS
jgi:hypothetical protein